LHHFSFSLHCKYRVLMEKSIHEEPQQNMIIWILSSQGGHFVSSQNYIPPTWVQLPPTKMAKKIYLNISILVTKFLNNFSKLARQFWKRFIQIKFSLTKWRGTPSKKNFSMGEIKIKLFVVCLFLSIRLYVSQKYQSLYFLQLISQSSTVESGWSYSLKR